MLKRGSNDRSTQVSGGEGGNGEAEDAGDCRLSEGWSVIEEDIGFRIVYACPRRIGEVLQQGF